MFLEDGCVTQLTVRAHLQKVSFYISHLIKFNKLFGEEGLKKETCFVSLHAGISL